MLTAHISYNSTVENAWMYTSIPLYIFISRFITKAFAWKDSRVRGLMAAMSLFVLFIQLRTAALRLIVRSWLDFPTFATRRLHACPHARAASGWRWNYRQEISWNFCLNVDLHVTFRDLLHAVKLRHGTDGFTSPPKEGVLRIFSPGCEPANLGTKSQHATSRPPKPLMLLLLQF